MNAIGALRGRVLPLAVDTKGFDIMTHVRRLAILGVILAVAALSSKIRTFAEPGKKPKFGDKAERKPLIEDDLAKTKFSDQNVLVYETREKERDFGWQQTPKIEVAKEPRKRDYLILVDTSASQARGPLQSAITITEAILKNLGDDERAAVWTANIEPKKLTKGFLPRNQHEEKVKDEVEYQVVKALKKEYPSGASNLRKAINDAITTFGDPEDNRQRVIILLGDGMSVASPINPDLLSSLAVELVKRQIVFYSVPLGGTLDPIFLHGMPSSTGGAVVRLNRDQNPDEFVKDLKASLDVPVLYPDNDRTTFTDNVVEHFPVKLPPLRADAPTLVIGKVNKGDKIGCTIVGAVNGREVRIDLSETLPNEEPDNFFLASMIQQWREQKDRPALLKADRALASAYEQISVAREELIAQAEWALDKNEFEAAGRLYEQALDLDPHNVDAKAGKHVVQQIKAGKINREQLRKLIQPRADDRVVRIDKAVRKGKVDRDALVKLAQEEKKADLKEDKVVIPPKPKDDDLLLQLKQRQVVEDQRNADLVKDAITEATRLYRVNPDLAIDQLKRTLAGVTDNPDISERMKRTLADRLRDEIRNVTVRGDEFRRVAADRAAALALARERLGQQQAERASEERTRERMKNINQLMTKARLEVIRGRTDQYYKRLEAIRASEKLILELHEEGQAVPPALRAAYGIALADLPLTELKELRRRRAQRFLLSFLEVERRHMPFVDEPPIEFPPAVQWKEVTQRRKGKYETFRFLGGSSNKNLKRVLDTLNTPVSEFAEIPADPKTTLPLILNGLSTKFSRPGENPPFFLTFEINMRAFEADGLNEEKMIDFSPVADRPLRKETNVSLASYLRKILERLTEKGPVPSGATFVIRKEADLPVIITNFDERDLPPPPNFVVEITTGTFAARHKETIAYSVSDLVIPIPNTINQQSLNQNATLFGAFGAQGGVLGTFGQIAGGQLGAIGAVGAGLGALGALGAGLGALGALGAGALGALGAGALGALGAGALGALGAGALGVGALGAGALGAGALGAAALGALGAGLGGLNQGALGALGGAIGQNGVAGQFGNLGGQFGLQGRTQERLLMQLIVQLVGQPGDWAGIDPVLAGGLPVGGGPGGVPGEGGVGMDNPRFGTLNDNQLGYFPSALALVVKGTSLIHSRTTRPAVGGMGAPPAGAGGGGGGGMLGKVPGFGRGDFLVIGAENRDPNGRVLGAGGGKEDDPKVVKDPKAPKKEPFKPSLDPRVAWQEALEKGIDDPGLIVATVDFLMLIGKYDQAAEFLKANLRQGVVVRPWVFETLAICLRESNASEEEIERAEVASADLEPQDAEAFLKASQAMAGMRRWDRALAFCRQAANLEPNAVQSYTDALNYAETAKDVDAMEWAASNLLKQDWPRNNGDLHRRARDKVHKLSEALGPDRAKEVERLKAMTKSHGQRDLIIRLTWAGQADLDLKVEEPSGSVCSCLQRQTPGGGTLMGDSLANKNLEVYVAAQAFHGHYKITVDRVWGQPLNGKAQIQIIRHQGSDQETSEVHMLDLKEGNTLGLTLDKGRRTQAAAVPPPSMEQNAEDLDFGMSSSELMSRLSGLADPEVTAVGSGRGFRGGVGSPGATVADEPLDVKAVRAAREEERNGRRVQQSRVSPIVPSDVSFTAQSVVSGDGRYVRVSLNPVFNVVTQKAVRPVISIIPGSGPRP
jgi:tetratricopeptide (TPR) repeat protein